MFKYVYSMFFGDKSLLPMQQVRTNAETPEQFFEEWKNEFLRGYQKGALMQFDEPNEQIIVRLETETEVSFFETYPKTVNMGGREEKIIGMFFVPLNKHQK